MPMSGSLDDAVTPREIHDGRAVQGIGRANKRGLSAFRRRKIPQRHGGNRPEYFTNQLHASLTLIDRGVHSAATRGSMHGEYGQTQFMPKSILNHGGNFGR